MAAIMAGLVFFNHGIIATAYLTEAKIGIIDQYVACWDRWLVKCRVLSKNINKFRPWSLLVSLNVKLRFYESTATPRTEFICTQLRAGKFEAEVTTIKD